MVEIDATVTETPDQEFIIGVWVINCIGRNCKKPERELLFEIPVTVFIGFGVNKYLTTNILNQELLQIRVNRILWELRKDFVPDNFNEDFVRRFRKAFVDKLS
jgi:hypothetical protein